MQPVRIRMEQEEIILADELAKRLPQTSAFRGLALSRAAVLRLALCRGLDVLEKQAVGDLVREV